MKYKHIVFDADGTLLDTEYAILLSLQDTVRTFLNKDMKFEELKFCLGIPGDATLEQLQIEDKQGAFHMWVDRLNAYYDHVKVFDGMRKVLDELKRQGCTLGVVTSKNRFMYDKEFAEHGIIEYFRTSICEEDSVEHKPTPGPLLKYMEEDVMVTAAYKDVVVEPVKLEIITQPKNASAAIGKDAAVSVEAVGDGLTYTWYYKNPGNVKFYVSGEQFVINGGAAYSIPMAAWRDGQEVYCVITDANGASAPLL